MYGKLVYIQVDSAGMFISQDQPDMYRKVMDAIIQDQILE
jgi:hypothetical protein